MYSVIHQLDCHDDLEGGGSLDSAIDACVVLTSDPKPRLRWNAELHERFIDAVTQLGGPDIKATPKTIMRTMGVKGLTLYHLKSHLQKYRLGKQSFKEFTESSKDASCGAKNQGTESPSSSSSRLLAQDLNDGYQVTEALRVQMEVQRRLHEQLKVQRHLHVRIKAQGKYLESILERACKALNQQQDVASVGIEAARQELSELSIKVNGDGLCVVPMDSLKLPLSEIAGTHLEERSLANGPSRLVDCSIDSCLSPTGSTISPMDGALQSAAIKKRPRPVLKSGEALGWASYMTPDMGWMNASS